MSPDRTRSDRGARGGSSARLMLDRLVTRSRLALAWESAWPAIWLPLGVVLAFAIFSWLGGWLDLSPGARRVGVAVFALALLVSFWPLLRLRIPGRGTALSRLDRSAGGHRPAQALEDTLALGSGDPGTRTLWNLHLRRAEVAIAGLRVTPPRPAMARRDPFALRAVGLLAAVAALFVAGPEAPRRLEAAFDWRGIEAAVSPFRVDGWIDPPHYTRLPPLMIDLAAGEQHLKAPVGSVLVIRVAGRGDAKLQPGVGLSPLKEVDNQKPDLREQRFTVTRSTELGIRTGLASSMRLVIEGIPDRPPLVALTGSPEVNARGTFTLAYKASDDYGIASLEGAVGHPGTAGRRSLVPAPHIALTPPADPRANDETRTNVDLTTHPWAGARVSLTLVAKDEAGQEGRSAALDFVLPQRPFTQPLARALVEQRRNLVLDPDRREPVQFALESLMVAPERFTPSPAVYLGLKAAADRLRSAGDDVSLTEVADLLWTMALQIEDGDLSTAERELRAAQQRLREAMERGDSEKEIGRLADELRAAMDKFLRELAERLRNNPQNSDEASRQADRTITSDDLTRMLDGMQDAMRRGDMAEAQRLLDQLQSVLENLRTARPGGKSGDPLAREMNRQMQELDGMIREQGELRDETFRQGQGQEGGRRQGRAERQRRDGTGPRSSGRGQAQRGQNGQGGESGQEGSPEGQQGSGQEGRSGLGQRQGALRDRLEQMQRRMRSLGMEGEQGFADAQGAMREAEGQLGQGREGSAVDSQGRALEGLQRGMQSMAQQMQQMLSGGDPSEGGEPNGPGNPQGRAQNNARNDDPLGRPTRSREFSDGRVRIPESSESSVERARRILEELRRKLGDPNRARDELDYFERLLRRN